MNEGAYFIDSSQTEHERSRVTFDKPFKISENPQVWDAIDKRMEKEARKLVPKIELLKQKIDHIFFKTYQHPFWKEKSKNIMHGVVNTINYILTKQSKGEVISTIVFLDKSARNAAYTIKKTWQELQKRGLIDSEISFPAIRFINVGQDQNSKFSAEHPKELYLQNIVSNPNFHTGPGEIVIYDEIIATGGSSQRAANIFKNLNKKKPDAVGGFPYSPTWAHDPTLKGIGNAEFSVHTIDAFEKIPLETVLEIREILLRIKRKTSLNVEQAIEIGLKGNSNNLIKKVNNWIFSQQEIQQFCDNLSLLNNKLEAKDIAEYLFSEGGFLARPFEDIEHQVKSRKHRLLLKKMVQMSINTIQLDT